MFKKFTSFVILLFVVSVPATSVLAATKKKQAGPIQASLVVDSKTGKVLHAYNAKRKIYPASLTKIMTIYLIFEALESGKLTLNHKLQVSKYATEALPSKLYLRAGERISVRDAILALTVKSANDVARVVGENIAGSEQKFARLMTIRARQLGMNNTNFTNASGWHDPKQVTTAVDLAKLSMAIKRDFPQYYHFFRQTNFAFKGKVITGHNRVTATYPGAEGLKTGYHTPAGCNLVTAATRGNKSLVGIVIGRKSSAVRDRHMVELLDQHFGVRHPTVKAIGKPKRKSIKLASRHKS
ncbi:MAG: D-alanyl-D-alanine carboxypeptidase family protein [Rickettsiaceae bacterium]